MNARGALLALASLACSCEGRAVGILVDASNDATVDAATDGALDATQVFPDGRVCRGHDEDLDGFPDECDDCPNVANREQELGREAVGVACRPAAPFASATERLFFDAFTEFGLWQSFGGAGAPFTLAADRDSLVGGTPLDDHVRFVATIPRAKSAAVVATAIVTIEEGGGRAGVLLRVSGDAKRFFACEVNLSLSSFLVSRAPASGCVGGPCKLETFEVPVDGGVGAAVAALPREMPRERGKAIGIRAAVTAGTDGGQLECRVFDPDAKAARNGLSAPDRYVLRVSVDAAHWIASGEVGLYAQGVRARFSSLDVLTAP